MDDLVACLSELNRMLDERGVTPGSITHTVEQLRVAVQQENFRLEHRLEGTLATKSGQEIFFSRIVDVVSERLGQTIRTEVKTGADLGQALRRGGGPEPGEVTQLVRDLVFGIRDDVQNLWHFSRVQLSEQNERLLATHLVRAEQQLREFGFSEEEIGRAFENLTFRFRGALDDSGEEVFRTAMEVLLGPQGKLAREAEAQASGSPDFVPAMQHVERKLETDAVAALDPDFSQLGDSIEESVEETVEQAAANVRTNAVTAVGTRLADTGSAISDLAGNIQGVVGSARELGEIWDKPNRSLDDYLTAAGNIGDVLTQGGQALQSLSGITQIATAAHSALNAVMLMNPVVLVVVAVVALIAAIAALIIYWDEVKAALRDNPWLAVIAAFTGIIGLVVVIIAYWDEIKLATLRAANFISIQVQRIGEFFQGVGRLIGQVWDFVVAKAANAGIAILNAFIRIGTSIQNFFIDVINGILSLYNEAATSTLGELAGLEAAELIPRADVEARLIPPREVPEISVEAAFASAGPITGGLESAIAEQEAAVAAAQEEDRLRRQREAEQEAAAQAPAVAPAAEAAAAPPALPAAAGAAAPEQVDQSVSVQGGITVHINAERLELDKAEVLSEEIVQALKQRLDALRTESDFRSGTRAAGAG